MSDSANIFTFDWDAEVSDEMRDRFFKHIVDVVRRWRLQIPVVLFLETAGPLNYVGSQALIAFSPFVAPLLSGGMTDVQRLTKILEKPGNVRLLIDRIIESEHDADSK